MEIVFVPFSLKKVTLIASDFAAMSLSDEANENSNNENVENEDEETEKYFEEECGYCEDGEPDEEGNKHCL